MDGATFKSSSPSSTRRRIRVRADLGVVLAFGDGQKVPARVVDLSTGGMSVRCQRVPSYGELVRVIVRLVESDDWHLIPARVRWFSGQGFGVSFESLDVRQSNALERFVAQSAA